jgi:hypothetical protein
MQIHSFGCQHDTDLVKWITGYLQCLSTQLRWCHSTLFDSRLRPYFATTSASFWDLNLVLQSPAQDYWMLHDKTIAVDSQMSLSISIFLISSRLDIHLPNFYLLYPRENGALDESLGVVSFSHRCSQLWRVYFARCFIATPRRILRPFTVQTAVVTITQPMWLCKPRMLHLLVFILGWSKRWRLLRCFWVMLHEMLQKIWPSGYFMKLSYSELCKLINSLSSTATITRHPAKETVETWDPTPVAAYSAKSHIKLGCVVHPIHFAGQ